MLLHEVKEKILVWFYNLALFAIPLVLYSLLMRRNRNDGRIHGVYSKPEWNFIFKKWWTFIKLRRQQQKFLAKFSENLLPSLEEEEVERPQQILCDETVDNKSFFGWDGKGNSLHLKILKRRYRIAEIWIHLRLSNGKIYQLPSHPHTVIHNTNSRSWIAEGLKFQICEPFSRWRITFNGLLRCGLSNQWINNEDCLEHIRFSFLWKACCSPVELPGDWCRLLLSEGIAREPWRNGDFLSMVNEFGRGYEQWGTMYGCVTHEDDVVEEVHIRGISHRLWGPCSTSWQHRAVSLTGVTSHGLMFTVTSSCSLTGISHATFGHVRMPNGKVSAITWCDLSLPDFAEHPEGIPEHLVLRFSAGGKRYVSIIDFLLDTRAIFYGDDPWSSETHVVQYQFIINEKEGNGAAQFQYRYNGSCPVPPPSYCEQLLEPEVESRSLVVSLSDRECQSSAAVGGKGASLALLTSLNSQFVVPPGFCLTVQAYNCHLESNPRLAQEIRTLMRISAESSVEDLRHKCERTVKIFEETPVCEAVTTKVLEAFRQLGSFQRYAVRSSAVGEDSEDLSAAGQNATFLGLQGESALAAAIQKCWGSLFSFHSVQYRRQNGQPLDCGMGVVVQQMVAADAAGVMFTRHPVTGNPKLMLITANYGLGETVVSSSADPDTIILSRDLRDNVAIESSVIGSKEHRIDMTENGTGVTEATRDSSVTGLCISQEEAISLGVIGIHLENLFGGPRDIEWAISKGKIYILQARPITSQDNWSDFELLHEFDTPLPSDEEVLSTANLGEVFPGATSPLSQTFIIPLINNGIKGVKRSYYLDQLHFSHYHALLNVINLILKDVEEEITIANKATDIAVFGHTTVTPEIHQIAKQRHGTGVIKKIATLWNFLKRTFLNKRYLNKTMALHEGFNLNINQNTARILYEEIKSSAYVQLKASAYHSSTSQVSVFTQIVSMLILTEGSQDITVDHTNDISLFLSSCSDIISAEVPASVKDIARNILRTGRGAEFSSLPPLLALEWIEVNSGVALLKYKELMSKHGHRGIKEFDVATQTWSMKPHTIIETIQSIVKQGQIESLETKREPLTTKEVISKLASVKKERTRKILGMLLPWCQKSVTMRESTKACLIGVVHQFRLAFRHLGSLMVEEGRLPDAELVFFFSFYELGQFLKNRDPAILKKAQRRRYLFSEWEKISFQEIIFGMPIPLNENKQPRCTGGSETTVQGTPVTQGTALGRACVVLELDEISSLKPGDILVTRSTDIGWSPYFPLLGGVVTELGGLISHGAVVAREYGLPCIVGAQNATKLFQTGDMVLLAASNGFLQKISEDN